MYSKLVNNTAVVIIANLSPLTFLQSERSNPAGNNDNNTTGNLALNSETIPLILKERHSIQKKSGGFSKK